MTLTRTKKSLLASTVAAGALILSACSGGSGSAGGGEAAQQSDGGQAAPAAAQKVDKAALTQAIEDGGYTVSTTQPSVGDLSKIFDSIEVEPAKCKDVYTAAMTQAQENLKNGDYVVGTKGGAGSAASGVSFDDVAKATQILDNQSSQLSGCEKVTMKIAGQSIESSMKKTDITVDGADAAMQVVTDMNMPTGAQKSTSLVARKGSTVISIVGTGSSDTGTDDLKKIIAALP